MTSDPGRNADSRPALDNLGMQSFMDYVADIRSLSALFSKSVFLAPIIAGLLLQLGPPWPSTLAISVLTSLAEILVCMYIFQRAQGFEEAHKPDLDSWSKRAVAITVAGLFLYLLLFSFFVKSMPDADHRDLKGLYHTSEAAKVISSTYTEDAALRGAGFDPTLVWAPWTVYLMRVVMIFMWLIFFCSLSSYLAMFVIRQKEREREERRAA